METQKCDDLDEKHKESIRQYLAVKEGARMKTRYAWHLHHNELAVILEQMQ
jgi:hypothetical protein